MSRSPAHPGPGPTVGPARIPPPRPVRMAAVLVIAEAAAVGVLALVVLLSGIRHHAAIGQLIGQVAYFAVFAALMAGCALALLSGRRWGRTPVIVLQVVLLAIAYWMATGSGRPALASLLAVVAVVTGGLLLSRPATAWISRFPLPFADH